MKKIIAIVTFIGVLAALIININNINKLFEKDVDLSGEWILNFHIKQSTYKPYLEKTAEYKVHLIQDNGKITGQGEKWKFDGVILPYKEHSPLVIEGTIKNDTLTCKYILKGSIRETAGSFKAYYNGNKITGTFTGTGADAKGLFYGNRILSSQ